MAVCVRTGGLLLLALVLVATLAPAAQAAPGDGIGGLEEPVSVDFLPDGRVYVAEKPGRIKTFDDMTGANGRVVVDISDKVRSFGDHGMTTVAYLGGYLYGAYSTDHPTDPAGENYGDLCGDYGEPAGRNNADVYGCPTVGHVSRWQVLADGSLGAEEAVLWGNPQYCFQFSTHSIGSLEVGPDGMLYISAGDGAGYYAADEGQFGPNICNDAPRQGGAFRSQTDAHLDGKIVRYDPATGSITEVARGSRNPFRISFGPNGELYSSDTGWATYEEINVTYPGTVPNFGWPCLEGPEPTPEYAGLNNPICNAIYAGGGTTAPFYAYHHNGGPASISALEYFDGRIYFGDYMYGTIWSIAMDGSDRREEVNGVVPVELRRTPSGELVYVHYLPPGMGEGAVLPLDVAPGGGGNDRTPSVTVNVDAQTYVPGQQVGFSATVNNIRNDVSFDWSVTLLTGCDSAGNCTRQALPEPGDLPNGSFAGPDAPAPAAVEVEVVVTASNGMVVTDDAIVQRAGGSGGGGGTGVPVDRIAGADRISSAVELSRRTYRPGVPVAFVARADDFPDALAAGPLAAAQGGPILLTGSGALSPVTAGELARLRPGRVVVLGGPAAVADAVVDALRADHADVQRVAGGNRFDTAAAVAAQVGPAATVYVATGATFPDALAAGAAAGMQDGAVLLTSRDALPPATEARLAAAPPQRIVLVGGEQAVSAAVANQLAAYAPVERVAGASRYDTSAALSQRVAAGGAATVFLASGENFPDALAVAPTAATSGAPLLLTARDTLPGATATELARLSPDRITVVGGPAAVSTAVEAAASQAAAGA